LLLVVARSQDRQEIRVFFGQKKSFSVCGCVSPATSTAKDSSMGQDELVLRVPPEAASRTSAKRDAEREESVTLPKQRSHSRESSGASNVSVKFTVHSDGSSSPKASVAAHYPFDAKAKPGPASRKRAPECDAAAERRERRRRTYLQSPARRNDATVAELSHDELSYEESDDDSFNAEDLGRLSPHLSSVTASAIRSEPILHPATVAGAECLFLLFVYFILHKNYAVTR
jgi:hypothetical protein